MSTRNKQEGPHWLQGTVLDVLLEHADRGKILILGRLCQPESLCSGDGHSRQSVTVVTHIYQYFMT